MFTCMKLGADFRFLHVAKECTLQIFAAVHSQLQGAACVSYVQPERS